MLKQLTKPSNDYTKSLDERNVSITPAQKKNRYLELGFSNNIYDNPRDVVGSVIQIAQDFTAIEIELSEEARPAVFEATPDEYAEIVQSLQQLIAEKNLSMSIHAEWFGTHTNLCASDEKERAASADLLRKSMKFAADIGAKVVTFHPGYKTKEDNRTLLENIVQSLNILVPEAQELGIELCLENMGGERRTTVVFTPEEHIEICERTGSKITVDVPHLASIYPNEDDFDRAIQTMMPYIKHIHLADTILPRHRHIPIGEGNLPLENIIKNLVNYGYEGDVIVEEFNRGYAPEAYLEGAKKFRSSLSF